MNDLQKRVRTLALSETGFLFDPTTGHTYTVNRTGGEILRALRDGTPEDELTACITDAFDVTEADAERDVAAFVRQLRDYRLIL